MKSCVSVLLHRWVEEKKHLWRTKLLLNLGLLSPLEATRGQWRLSFGLKLDHMAKISYSITLYANKLVVCEISNKKTAETFGWQRCTDRFLEECVFFFFFWPTLPTTPCTKKGVCGRFQCSLVRVDVMFNYFHAWYWGCER